MPRAKLLFTSAATIAAITTAACATAGQSQRAPAGITQAEARQGAEAHPQLLAEFGGAMTGPQAQYVEGVGKRIAVQSGLSNAQGAFTVSLLNSPVNNAFAIPGGYVYVTRQLVALMNNEAELAGVLGHEVGHVAARHSQRRQQAATRNTILGGLGAILSGVLLGNSGIGQQVSQGLLQGSQLLTLRFSRQQEIEADRLGIQYLSRAGYDPQAMGTVLTSLAAQNQLDAQLQGRRDASIPAWASTHPDPASRVRGAAQFAQGKPGALTNRDTFLTRIDGLRYGDDPAQGVIEGQQFLHPELRLAFSVPQGYIMVNNPRDVTIQGQGGQAQFTLAPYNGNLETYIRSVFAALGGERQQLAPANLQRQTVNGLPALVGTARVNNGRQQVDVVVFAYEFARDRAYHFTAITPAGRAGVFAPMFDSVRRISSQEAAAVVPRQIDVVTVRAGDTVQSLSRRMAFDTGQEARFRVLNGLTSGATVQPGQKVKIVVRGR